VHRQALLGFSPGGDATMLMTAWEQATGIRIGLGPSNFQGAHAGRRQQPCPCELTLRLVHDGRLRSVPAERCSAAVSLMLDLLPCWLRLCQIKHSCTCVLPATGCSARTLGPVSMASPTARQQLVRALPGLFADKDPEFCGRAALKSPSSPTWLLVC
jgi:hypothetical protein